MRRMSGFQDLGVTLALDDFRNRLLFARHLRRFSGDVLKMDESFLDDIPGNEQDEAVVRAIVDIGTTLQLQLIAEGV